MDIKMPDMDGIEAAHGADRGAHAPVVLLSAYSQRELVQRAGRGRRRLPGQALSREELTPAIEIALARFASFRTCRSRWSDLQEALETRKLVDRAKGILMDKQGSQKVKPFARSRR